MNLKAAIAGAIGVTALTGTLLFKTDVAQNVWNNIVELKNKIEAFAANDKDLVKEYYALKKAAETKITELENELKNNTNTSAAEKAELEKQINIANKAIQDLEKESDAIVEEVNKLKPTDPDSLPGLGEDKEEVNIAAATANFKVDNTRVSITLNEDIDLGFLSSKGNIEIKFTDANDETLTKNKYIYSGYLNDSQGNKYGRGPENNKNYLTKLVAGNTYYTTLSVDNKPDISKIDATKIVKVEVTVTDNNGEKHILKPIEK